MGCLPLSYAGRGNPETSPKTTQATSADCGWPPELGDKTLLLKIPHTLVKWDKKLPFCWLHFAGEEGAM